MKFITTGAAAAPNDPEMIHGHALMISCPPESHSLYNSNTDWGVKTLDAPASDLSFLFHLSNRLQLHGEMTPISVWAMITTLDQFPELDLSDFEFIKQELLPKVSCHGFGAVVEEGDVHGVLGRLFAARFGVAYDV